MSEVTSNHRNPESEVEIFAGREGWVDDHFDVEDVTRESPRPAVDAGPDLAAPDGGLASVTIV